MRDEERIDVFCEKLRQYWHKVPDWRFGQLVANVLGEDPFYIEDDRAEEAFRVFFKPTEAAPSRLAVYTDGACSMNGKEGAKAGWAFCVVNEETDELIYSDNGGIPNGTNNIGELTAIYEALRYLRQNYVTTKAVIYSDSAYCINGVTNWRYNWKKNDWWRDKAKTQELKNRQLWKNIDALIDTTYLEFEKVSAHTGVKWNEYVDAMAVEGRESI